jgi:hypothetical protein
VDESKMGEMRRVRRKMGSITILIELVINEGERAFIYTWRDKFTPLGCKTSVHTQAIVIILRRAHF